jgi:hypothetical protein
MAKQSLPGKLKLKQAMIDKKTIHLKICALPKRRLVRWTGFGELMELCQLWGRRFDPTEDSALVLKAEVALLVLAICYRYFDMRIMLDPIMCRSHYTAKLRETTANRFLSLPFLITRIVSKFTIPTHFSYNIIRLINKVDAIYTIPENVMGLNLFVRHGWRELT